MPLILYLPFEDCVVQDWNVIVTVFQEGHRRALRALGVSREVPTTMSW